MTVTLAGPDPRLGADDEVAVTLRGRRDEHDDALDVRLKRFAIEYRGRTIPIRSAGMSIGSGPHDGIAVDGTGVDADHGEVVPHDQGFAYVDHGAGSFLNGSRIVGTRHPLRDGDSIAVGSEILRFRTSTAERYAPIVAAIDPTSLRLDRARLLLGRGPDSDVVLDHPTVSLHHAEIVATNQGARLRNLAGTVGTSVNGRQVSRAYLVEGDEIGIGPYRLIYDGSLLVQRDAGQGLRLLADGITMRAGDKTILQPTSLAVEPGELVAIIGESGAGKSTLIKSLAGVTPPSAGIATVNGEDVALRQVEIGYVPQDEIVHPGLSVREALGYAAELRLPPDTPPQERAAAVERVVAEVSLEPHADTLIGSLSGGQRKRAGLATELVDRPGLLFLDEPTTGLDPGLERKLMQLLRSLAANERSVVLVTHATRSLAICDRVVVMASGGYLAFSGPPADALEFFGVEHPDDIYDALESRAPEQWATALANSRFAVSARRPGQTADVGRRPAKPPREPWPQAWTLARRYALLFTRDRRNLAIVAAQIVLLGLATGSLFKPGVFHRVAAGQSAPPGYMHANESGQLLFLLVTIALWFGSISASREIIKERAVVARELAIGVRIPAYLMSKALLLFAVSGIQTMALTAIVLQLRPLEQSGAATVMLLLVLTAWVGVAMGLTVSAFVRSEEQASSFIPLVLIPQLLFGGAIVPLKQMGEPIRALANLFAARWSYAGTGSVIDMHARIQSDPIFAPASRYGASFFTLGAGTAALVLMVFLGVLAWFVDWRLRRTLLPRRPREAGLVRGQTFTT